MFTHADTTGNFNGLCGAIKEQNEPFILVYKSDTKLPESVNCPQCIASFVPAKPKKTLSSLRQRLNKARKLQPQFCTRFSPSNFQIDDKTYTVSTQWKEIWSMASATDETTHYQVKVIRSQNVTSVNSNGKITKTQYHVHCQKVGCPDMCDCEGGKKTVCYHALATIRAMARSKGKKVVFCRDMKNALLKRGIYKGALIEVKSGSKSVYGIAY